MKGTPAPNPIPVIIYNQPLIDVPDSEDKLCWEKKCRLLKLLAAVMEAMLFLWDPIKLK